MELILIGIVALIASGLTFFSGFGLGTILMPVFALFVPLPLAIAATAIVHFSNNIFKFFLVAKQADWHVVSLFTIPAAIAAMAGAASLNRIDQFPSLLNYNIGGSMHEVTMIKIIIGILIVAFSLLELSHRLQQTIALPIRWLPLGGLLSGFIGGLSGNQGALRSAFLIRAGLSKNAFISTSIVSSVIVDAARLAIYGVGFLQGSFISLQQQLLPSVSAGIVGAFIGSLIGMYFLRKVTLHIVQTIVAVMLLMVGAGLIVGVL
jgi:uncharacterized membrane protein YfcA